MATAATPTPEFARRGQAGERAFEEMIERVPEELLLAENPPRERSDATDFDDVEQDFWTDPCRFLRRACQVADYGSTALESRSPEA